jgi:hypothetical protein
MRFHQKMMAYIEDPAGIAGESDDWGSEVESEILLRGRDVMQARRIAVNHTLLRAGPDPPQRILGNALDKRKPQTLDSLSQVEPGTIEAIESEFRAYPQPARMVLKKAI